MEKEELRRLLNQPYEQANWKKVIDFVFPNVAYPIHPLEIVTDNKIVESFKQLGTVRMNDGKNLALFEVRVVPEVNIVRNRVELRNLVSSYIDQERNHGVLVIYEQGKEDYRFTFTAKDTLFDEGEGDFVAKETDTKRFTYVLGEHESCKTPAQRFYSLAEKKSQATIEDVEEAFSVEKLSKQFFKEYKQHYELLVNYLVAHDGYRRTTFKVDEKAIRDFVKLLLGRLVFIQFVQKKRWIGVPANETGWQGGDVNFLYNSFKHFEHKNLFYSSFLEPLFYEALNKGGRPNELFELTGTKIPYLNGGLFEKSEVDTSFVNFPATYFEGLLEFFDRYNFTIDENDPEEHEVGIDPEMLGHVFENLLEDNKDKGAFYTPKEIVHYMCQESLKEYLKTYLQGKQLWPDNETDGQQMDESLQLFVNKKEAGGVIDFDESLATALRDVKICDPAIGSGAFPMGLLNEIFQCMYVLYHASPDIVGDIWGMDTWQPQVVKANIIQNSIYGVDIEKGAVDIARLRFWLSLIVDEPEPTALPNLDYKIVVGNSLVSKLGDDIIDIDWKISSKDQQTNIFGTGELHDIKFELLKKISFKQKEFFSVDGDKSRLALDIRDLKIEILITQLNLMVKSTGLEEKPVGNHKNIKKQTELWLQTLGWKKQVDKLNNLKTKPEEALHFFDWKLDFPEVLNPKLVNNNGGFDIVIGNPPYVEAKKLKYISQYLKGFRVYSGTADLSSYFFDRGNEICKNLGLLCLINTNKFFNTGYGKSVRSLIIENEIKQLLNFEQVEVFEGILVSSVIISIKKKVPEDYNEFAYKRFFKLKNTEFVQTFLYETKNRESYKQKQLTEKEWSFADKSNLDLKSRIEYNSVLLKNLKDVNVFRGVTTGYNPAFIISKELRDELIGRDTNNFIIIKPLLQGRNIKKWVYNFNDEYLIFTKQGIQIDSYPTIKEHLSTFQNELKPRIDNESCGRKPGSYKWFEIQDNTAYHPEFENPKIIWGLTADKWAYAYDDKQHFLPSNGYILTSKEIPIKYLLGLINSDLLKYYFGFIGVMTAGGAYTLKHATIQQLPMKVLANPSLFIEIVDQILEHKSQGKDTNTLEEQINSLVYKLYQLTYDEVLVIDPKFTERMSREEYEKLEPENG